MEITCYALFVFCFMCKANGENTTEISLITSNETVAVVTSNETIAKQNCSEAKKGFNLQCIDNELKTGQSSLLQLLLVTALSGGWIIYLTLFNSRFVGLIISKVVNQFIKDAYFHVGSFSISVLSGKLMFRDVCFITKDMSLRIHDGYCIFRWWRPYHHHTNSEWKKERDLSHGHTRLSIVLSGFEFHLYNRSKEYERLKNLFGQQEKSDEKDDKIVKKAENNTNENELPWWRTLIPVIKFSLSYGKVVFGNRLLPNSFVIAFTEAEFQYKTTEASNPYDTFLHVLEGTLGTLTVMLVASMGYDPSAAPEILEITDAHNEPPPRKMGEGYNVLRSSNVFIKSCWDESGRVPVENKDTNLKQNCDDQQPLTDRVGIDPSTIPDPMWNLIVRFGKHTTLNFSPWADRQREVLYKFFYPSDYQPLEVTKIPEPGEFRQVKTIKVSATLAKGADVDILYAKKEEIHAIQIHMLEGSFVDVDVPMVTGKDGYTSRVQGQLLHVDISTSMQYRSLLQAEMFGFDVESHYPLQWNACQTWKCNINASKASVSLLFAHKDFISDLMDDWAVTSPPDLMFFVPYTFAVSVNLDELEVFIPLNDHNWIDCDTKPKENAYLGFYGKQLLMDLSLPFYNFLPPTFTVPVNIHLIGGQLSLCLPESNMTRNTLLNLARQQRKWDEMKNEKSCSINWSKCEAKSWGMITSEWIVCGEIPMADLLFDYTWHPIVPPFHPKTALKSATQSSKRLLGPDKRSTLSITDKRDGSKGRAKSVVTFDPTTLESDEIRIDVTLNPGPTVILYGTTIELFIAFKEDYLGYDDVYTDFKSKPHLPEDKKSTAPASEVDLLQHRPLQVTVNVSLEDVKGIMPVHPNSMFECQPMVHLKLLHFEMDKNYLQTRLQALLSGLEISVKDKSKSSPSQNTLMDGGLVRLDDLQFRGHAMFSGAGIPLSADTIEYAWMTEVLVGEIKGRLSITQIKALAEWGEVFAFLFSSDANKLIKAFPYRILPTGITWDYKKKDDSDVQETDVKYTMMRARLEGVHLQLDQDKSLIDLHVSPVLISNGNVQESGVQEAVSITVDEVEVKHHIAKFKNDEWLEAGEIRLGPLFTQITIATEETEMSSMQRDFLRFHDRKTRRLDFLWEQNFAGNMRRASIGMASALENVRLMKSWGCDFFTAVTSKHPTFFYENKDDDPHFMSHYPDYDDTHGSDVTDAAGAPEEDTDEDVFDSSRDYGMSLIVDGKRLIDRQPPVKKRRAIVKVSPTNQPIAAGLLLTGADGASAASPPSQTLKKEVERSISADDSREKLARVTSTDSHIFQSAESMVKSASSTSSSESFYSAESDVENLSPSKLSKSASDQALDQTITEQDSVSPIAAKITRPEHLDIQKKGGVVRRLDMTDNDEEDSYSPQSPLPLYDRSHGFDSPKKSLIHDDVLMSCYSYILPSSKVENSDWLSEFSTVQSGIHPSVIIDRDENYANINKRQPVDVMCRKAASNCTTAALHVKGDIDVQFSPYVLDFVQQAIDTLATAIEKQHPIAVLTQLLIKSTSDAVTDYHLNKLETDDVGYVFAPSFRQPDKPGTRLEIFMDSVRVNIVQATLGDDAVFNLRLNKLLPTPCLTVAAIRLDRLDIKLQLNNKKEKLLSKALKKNHRLSITTTDEDSDDKEKSSTKSEPNLILFLGHTSVQSLSCQLRVLSHDGCAPDRSNVTALADESCRSPFKFNNKVLLPRVKHSFAKYADLHRRPPKPWGWVVFEGGIRKISARLTKYGISAQNPTSLQHCCDGNLTVDLLWLNVVSPPSPSQVSKSNRSYRSWGLLTTLAPTCSAWLAPGDRLAGAIDRLHHVITSSYFVPTAAVLSMVSHHIFQSGDNSLARRRDHKYDVLSELSMAVRNDPSCLLCDSMQRFLLSDENISALEAAVKEDCGVPTLTTLETGIEVLLGHWLALARKPVKKGKSYKKKMYETLQEATTSQPEQESHTGVTYGGNLEIETLLPRGSESTERPPVDGNSRTPLEINERAEDLVHEQQRSMYSWMQSETQHDMEAQVNRKIIEAVAKDEAANIKEESDARLQEAKKMYANFLTNVGVSRSAKNGQSFIQSFCSGSLAVKTVLKTIRIDKQEPDRVYSRAVSRKRKKQHAIRQLLRKHTVVSYEAPILVCHDLTFDLSVTDTPIGEKSSAQLNKGLENVSSNNNNKQNIALRRLSKNRSKLIVNLGCSLKLAKQRIDISLVRLVHQFSLCSDAIQQAKTDMQVNKYTAGNISPDPAPTHTHKRGLSTFSIRPSSTEQTHGFVLKRRFTSPTTPRLPGVDAESMTSSSVESIVPADCWQELYKLVDQHSAESLHTYRVPEMKIESEMRRRFSSVYRMTPTSDPFVSMEMSATVKLEKLQLLAEVGDLKLSTSLCDLTTTASHTRTSVKPFKHEAASSMRAELKEIHGDVTEYFANMKKAILTGHVGLCQLEASTNHQRDSENGNTCSLLIGRIKIDLPQHPASLHDVVSRSTRQLSTHIQEFAMTPHYKQSFDTTDGLVPSMTPSTATIIPATPMTPSAITALIDISQDSSDVNSLPVVVSVSIQAEGLEVGSHLLPSLTVRYTTAAISGKGVTGSDASFDIAMLSHSLHFAPLSSNVDEFRTEPTQIDLPPIKADGELRQHKIYGTRDESELQMKEGEYLFISVNVGNFEHTLTTDLFNQLVFLQEVFVNEINDVLEKVSSSDKAASIWSDSSLKSAESSGRDKPMLYQLQLQLDGIQLTASTPSRNAIRLKTGMMTFELSNRVIRAGKKLQSFPKYLKLFGKAQVELNLAIGTLIENSVYPEVEPEFHQLSYFTTHVGLQNTTQQASELPKMQTLGAPDRSGVDNSVILISLMRPIFFVQPTAFDKAILIFLAYKNTYDEWQEKMEAVDSDLHRRARKMYSALQSRTSNLNTTTPALTSSSLFLQLSVKDIGICLPVLRDVTSYDLSAQDELSSALVLTIDNTLISACYAKSLVTTGHFKGFCLRFADDFQTSWDDWSPKSDLTNSFVVPEGTYQICTDTTSTQSLGSMRARTTANVVWQMKGMDIKLDTKVGAYITHLINTMTLITGNDMPRDLSSSEKLTHGSESESFGDTEMTSAEDVVDARPKTSPLVPRVSSTSKELSFKEKSKKIEQEYYEQVRVVNDLRSLGAKHSTVEEQERRLQELEGAISSIFRQTVKNKLRRSSIKAGTTKKEPLLSRGTHKRSVSSGSTSSKHNVKPRASKSAFATLPSLKYRPPLYEEWRTSPSESTIPSKKSAPIVCGYESSDESSDSDSDVADILGEDLQQNHTVVDGMPDTTLFSPSAPQPEADLELILDVKVVLDGGQIVCQPNKEEDNGIESGATSKNYPASKKLFETNATTFYVPGVEVKIRYNSEVGERRSQQEFVTPPGSPSGPLRLPQIEVESPGGSLLVKKRSCVYLWFSLQSLPETIISPCFLDFLEQTVKVVPVTPASSAAPLPPDPDGPGAVEALDHTIESLPVDVVVFVSVQPSQVLFNCQPMSRVECLLHIPSLDLVLSSIRSPPQTPTFTFPDGTPEAFNFSSPPQSLPKAFPTGLGITAVMSDFSVYVFHPYGTQLASGVEQKSGSGRKDSLSVDLEVVRVSIVRTKKGAVNMEKSFSVKENAIVINMSVLLDIGKASFKYDMRRLSEILAFPKAWYRRSIARMLFLGNLVEERLGRSEHELSESPLAPKRSQVPRQPRKKEDWLSIVLYGLKMSRLDVQMNMSNVMGNTLLSCDELTSQGKLTLQSSGDKDFFLSCGLVNSQLSAKGGIIGGQMELKQLFANCHLLEPIASEPRHKVCVKMQSLVGRIEYMGGCIMMGKLTMVCLKLSDEWKSPKPNTPAAIEKSSVFVPGDFGWDNFSLVISRSSTPDVIKMLAKLEEFFTQQFQNSVRALSSWRTPSRRDIRLSRHASVSSPQEVYAFHRHWPAVYSVIHSLGSLPNLLLGGSLCLHGNQLTIVCFHGNNFRSRAWVLFNILEPNIMFLTEVQEIKESLSGDETSTLSTQSLIFNLGHDYWLKTVSSSSDPMATVSRVTRSRHENPPPSSASMEEWFAYVTASHNQELSMLRTLNDMNEGDSPPDGASRQASSSSYSHDTDIIFALPKLQLDFKTEHMQGPHEPDPKSFEQPVVECSFVTEFTDHICVTMDVELIMCLHDLISSYLKEKQQALQSRRLSGVASDYHVASVDPIDPRKFICNTWQLEPTVRLISWAGRRIEPVGVDHILHKLGFTHARLTIPKWFQRGVLDVLDRTLAVIVQNLVVAMMQRKKQ